MEADVLVDSNVYFDLLKHRHDPAKLLGEWAGKRDLVICGMVRIEVLRGIKNLGLFERLSGFMDVMIKVQTNEKLWAEATALGWRLDRKGKIIPGPDLVIAACAMRLSADILTSDKHFQNIDGLNALSPPADWFA